LTIALSACGGGAGAGAPAGVVHALAAWRAAGADYDRAIHSCAATPTPAIDFWAHCTATARGRYARTVRTLDRQLDRHARSGPCAATDALAVRDVAAVTSAYRHSEVVMNRELNSFDRRHRSSGPSLATLIAQAHAARVRGNSAVAALAGHASHHCLR
jgi:hypothetical protein